MKIKIFPLTADATLAQRRRRVMKLQRKHKMPEICSWLIVAAAAASATWLTLSRSLAAAQDDDDSEMHQHHMDLLHHQQQHSDFIIGESEERDHIAHHLVPPMIWIQNQLVGAALAQNISLECQSEAYPKSINYWMKNDTIIVPGERFVPETFESGYKITMRLTIYDVDISDFGAYRCVAKNSLGDTDGAIKLYHIPQTTTITTMAPTVSINTVPVVIVKYNKEQRYSSNSNANSNNPYNHNNQLGNNKSQRTKAKSLDQPPPATLNNVYMGATSSLWNTQDHHSPGTQRGRDHHQQQQHLVPDNSATYRADGKNNPLKHDAKSLTDEMDRMQDLKGWAAAGPLYNSRRSTKLLTLVLAVYLGAWQA
ncbi:uncharacterized protein DIP-theta isoform X4 [Drosophila virilis]|uniref:uncharacterized protein DIP-theta isoform X4 n=1 Tax=Drosophila virilis TaxID=7244 RepID=UPI001395FEBC|nr:uncharacterized protein LOC6627947 isoform X6 [Drosophila virilis]